MRNAKTILALALGCAVGLLAQSIYVPVNAPHAQKLVVETEKAHPELQKLGLHVIPPGQTEYAIVANTFPSKIGKKSSAADLAVLTTGKATVKNDDRGKFFDLCLPISDAAGRSIGITVMEIPYSHAKDSTEALAKATAVRDQMQKQIASQAQLFEETTAPLALIETVSLPAAVKGHFRSCWRGPQARPVVCDARGLSCRACPRPRHRKAPGYDQRNLEAARCSLSRGS